MSITSESTQARRPFRCSAQISRVSSASLRAVRCIKPLPVQSWRQFQAYFGDFTGAGYLAYAVRAFFENGGQRCWVVRVASEIAATAAVTLQSASLGDVWMVSASSPGVWGNDLDIVVRETHRAQTLTLPQASAPEFSTVALHYRIWPRHPGSSLTGRDPDLQSRIGCRCHQESTPVGQSETAKRSCPTTVVLSGFDPDRPILIESVEYTLWVKELGRLIRVYEGLSLVPEHRRYGPAILAKLKLPRLFRPTRDAPVRAGAGGDRRIALAPLSDLLEPIATTTDEIIPLTGGADGLAQLSTYDFIGEEIDPLDSDEVRARKAPRLASAGRDA